MNPADLPFPPLGNRGMWSIAAAAVDPDPAFADLADRLATVADGACAHAVAPSERWLSAAARTANDQRFRFELTHLHADELPPWVGDVAAIASTGFVGSPAVAAGRATAKLVVLLGVHGDGRAVVSAPGMDGNAELRRGQLLVAPAFASLTVAPPAGPLRVLAVSIAGPAFR